jgi:hypothetical protein
VKTAVVVLLLVVGVVGYGLAADPFIDLGNRIEILSQFTPDLENEAALKKAMLQVAWTKELAQLIMMYEQIKRFKSKDGLSGTIPEQQLYENSRKRF